MNGQGDGDRKSDTVLFQGGFDEYLAHVDALEQRELGDKPPMIGFPMNLRQVDKLSAFRNVLARHAVQNNCGDPFSATGNKDRPFSFNTLDSERKLLEKLMADWGGDPSNTWGYVTTGGTEGVIRGLQAGLMNLHSKCKKIMVIYSDQAHYCVSKACNLLLGGFVGQIALVAHLKPNGKGELDLVQLHELVQTGMGMLGVDGFLLMPTLGTTFLGACDDLGGIWRVLKEQGVPSENVWIHVDAALNGGFWNLPNANTPSYSIQQDFHSISVSGHKWWGGFIAGYIFVRRDLFEESRAAETNTQLTIKYVRLVDKMISGSRPGDAAILWTARLLQFDWAQELEMCLQAAAFLTQELEKLGVAYARTNLNVVFPAPSKDLVEHFQLMTIDENCQIVVLPHVTQELLAEFLQSYGHQVAAGLVERSNELLENFNR